MNIYNINHKTKTIVINRTNVSKTNNPDIDYVNLTAGTRAVVNIYLNQRGYKLIVKYIQYKNIKSKKNNKPSFTITKTVKSLKLLGLRTKTKSGNLFFRNRLKCIEVKSTKLSQQKPSVSFGAYSNGLGAVHMGMTEAKLNVNQKYSFEIDKYAKQTLAYNYNIEKQYNDIFDADAKTLPQVDIVSAGFPCQPFSKSGKLGGFEDKRGTIIFKLKDTFLDLVQLDKAPKIIFLENVSNLISHNKNDGSFESKYCEKDFDKKIGHTMMTIETKVFEPLSKYYDITWWLDNTTNYKNIPHNRQRWFCVMTLKTSNFSFDLELLKSKRIPLTATFNDLLDNDKDVDKSCYYTKNKFIAGNYSNGGVLKQVGIIENVKFNQGKRVLSTYGCASCLTCGEASKYYIDGKLRIPTVTERMRLHKIPNWFKFDPNTSKTQRIKQLGNTMSINVVQSIFETLFDKSTFKTDISITKVNNTNYTPLRKVA